MKGEEIATKQLIEHIKKWTIDRKTDVDANRGRNLIDINNLASLANGNGNDISQLINWCLEIAQKIQELESNKEREE